MRKRGYTIIPFCGEELYTLDVDIRFLEDRSIDLAYYTAPLEVRRVYF
jgi:hypothetical protein